MSFSYILVLELLLTKRYRSSTSEVINFRDHQLSKIVKHCQDITLQRPAPPKSSPRLRKCVNLLELNTPLAIMSPTKYAVANAVAVRPNHARKLILQLMFGTGHVSNVESETSIAS
jgi:hypothetical protein